MNSSVRIFGTDTCKDTLATRRHLEQLEVPYEYVNIELDQAASRQVEQWNGGKRKTPTVVLHSLTEDCDGPRILSVPSNTSMDAALDQAELLPRSPDGDGSSGLD